MPVPPKSLADLLQYVTTEHTLKATALKVPVIIFLPNLPTADPGVPGRLWNSSGTLKVSV